MKASTCRHRSQAVDPKFSFVAFHQARVFAQDRGAFGTEVIFTSTTPGIACSRDRPRWGDGRRRGSHGSPRVPALRVILETVVCGVRTAVGAIMFKAPRWRQSANSLQDNGGFQGCFSARAETSLNRSRDVFSAILAGPDVCIAAECSRTGR